MNRAVDLTGGMVYVVSDLHGEWQPYARYRDDFLTLHAAGQADSIVFLGDIVHGYGTPDEDYSLEMVLDIIQLQSELGSDRVVMLLGNHEFPHIYGVTLSKGDTVFTPRFEHSLGSYRKTVISFFRTLPFVVRTAGGVLLTHAGASPMTAQPEAAERLLGFSHEALLAEVDRLLDRPDVQDLLAAYGRELGRDYAELAWEFLAAGPDDPRYLDLLRGFLAGNLEPEWSELWELFFTQCERQHTTFYEHIVDGFLEAFGGGSQRVLLTGHIPVKGSHAIVADKQFRLASWAHASPVSAGAALLFDAGQQVYEAADLEGCLRPIARL